MCYLTQSIFAKHCLITVVNVEYYIDYWNITDNWQQLVVHSPAWNVVVAVFVFSGEVRKPLVSDKNLFHLNLVFLNGYGACMSLQLCVCTWSDFTSAQPAERTQSTPHT